MLNRSARHTQVSTRSSSFKLAKSGNNLAGLTTRPNMVAIAVAASMLPTGVWAGWNKNVEIFADYNSDRSFGGVQALIPLRQTADDMTFLGLRGQYGERGDWEINLGAGHRWFNASREWIFGGYGYLDSREAASDERYNQISIGAEALSVDWDLRANYYKAIGDTDNVVGTSGTAFKGFSVFTNGLLEEALDGGDIEVGHLIPKAPWETRVFVGGYYYDGDKNPDSIDGLRARIETRPRKNIILGLTYSNDDVNEDSVYLEVKYSFGYANESGHRTLEERMIQLPVRDVDIVLTPRPFISDDLSDATVISSNALHIQKDHNAAEDELSAPLGSYENPFQSIAECNSAEAGCQTEALDHTGEFDHIFVHGVLESGADGNGRTTAAKPYSGQFSLLDNQHLIGQGVGIFGVGGASATPEVYYPGDVVILSEDTDGDGFSNEVAGLNLVGSFNEVAGLNLVGLGGVISGRNVTGFDIHDNVIEGGQNGIRLTYDAFGGVQDGNGSIRNNEILGRNRLLNDTIKSRAIYVSSGHGIYIDVGAGTFNQTLDLEVGGSASTFNQTLDLSDNYIAYNDGSGVHISTGNIRGDFTVNQQLTLSDNTIVNNIAGVENILNAYYGGEINQTVALTNNEISHNPGSRNTGVNIGATVGYNGFNNTTTQVVSLASADLINQVVTLDGNNIAYNSGDGVSISVQGNNNGAEINQTVTLSDNDVNYNSGNGININSDVSSLGTQSQTITLTGNTASYNRGNGIGISGNAGRRGSLNQDITLSNNSVDDNYHDGISISSDAGYDSTQIQDITLTGNSANYNYGNGIGIGSDAGFGSYGTQSQTITLTGNTVTYNNGGINIESDGSAGTQNQTITLSDNTVNHNDYGGIDINSSVGGYYGTANQTLMVTNNTVSNNRGDGIYISSSVSSHGTQNQTITLTGNTVSDNTAVYGNYGNGIVLENKASGNAQATQNVVLTGETVTGNAGDGVYIYNYEFGGTAIQTVDLSDAGNDFSDNVGDYYSANDGGTQDVILPLP